MIQYGFKHGSLAWGWKQPTATQHRRGFCSLARVRLYHQTVINKFEKRTIENMAKFLDTTGVSYHPDKGFCIRCKNEVELNNLQPYCSDCFKIWSKFKNKNYKEKYCHVCGKTNDSTFIKPICFSCYKIQKTV